MADDTDNSASDNAGIETAVGAIGALLDKGLIEDSADSPTDHQLRERRAARAAVLEETKRKPKATGEQPPAKVSKTVTQPEAESEEDDAEEESEEETSERDASDDEDDADATEDNQEPTPLKLKDIAAKAGVKETDFDNLTLTVKVNGEERETTLKDLRDGYQLRSAIDQKAQRLNQEREAFKRSQSETDTETRRVLGIAAKVMQAQKARFVGQRPDDQFRIQNGDDAFAREDSLWRRRNEEYDGDVDRVLDLIREENGKLGKKASEFQAQHRERLRTIRPEYFDEKKGPERHRQLVQYLAAKGITPEEMQVMHDSRLIDIATDAMEGHALKTGKPLEAKKVKSSTKPIRTAMADEPEEVRRTGTQHLRTKFRRGGGRDMDQAAKIFSRMGLGSAR